MWTIDVGRAAWVVVVLRVITSLGNRGPYGQFLSRRLIEAAALRLASWESAPPVWGEETRRMPLTR